MAINSNIHSDKTFININDAARAVAAYGDKITPILIGEPGIGKSMVLEQLKPILGDDYDYIYVDCPVMDLSDILMRVPDRESGELVQYVSSLFKLKNGRKKVIMLDEYMKSPKLLQIIWTRLTNDRMLGDEKVEGYLFATSNHSTDGVGDAMLAHGSNRVMKLYVSKPPAPAWLVWATDNNIATQIRAWVAMNPNSLASFYDGGQEDNPLIFNPTKRNDSYVTPRSLAKCDPVVRARDKMGDTITHAAIAGLLGASAAQSMAAFLSLERELVPVRDIIKNPTTTAIPEKMAALFMTMFNAVDTIETQDDLSNFMQYVNRVSSSEIQSVFFTMLLQSKRTTRLAKNNTDVMNWAKDNYELLM